MLRNAPKMFRSIFGGLALGALLGGGAFAQTAPPPSKAPAPKPSGRDPFNQAPWVKRTAPPKPVIAPKPIVAKAVKVTPVPTVIEPPKIESRISYYKEQKLAALKEQVAPPKPTTVLLIDEIEVAGIFRTPRGYAAMVQAKPIKLSYIIYPGEQLYDGQLVAIDEDHLVFRHHLSWSDGRSEDKVERKALRQPGAADELAAEKTTPGAATAPTAAAIPANVAPETPGDKAAPNPTAAAPATPGKPSFANVLINSLPARANETETTKSAPEFSGPPAAAPKPAADKAKAPAKIKGAKKPAAQAKPKTAAKPAA